MELACERCGAGITPAEMDSALALASCGACAHVFSYAGALGYDERNALARTLDAAAGVAPAAAAPIPELPPGLDVAEFDGHMLVVIGWLDWKVLVVAVGALLPNVLLVGAYAVAIVAGEPLELGPLALLVLGAGAAIAYYVLCGFVNRTEILVAPDRLNIRHRPLPWVGNLDLHRRDLSQLFCQRRLERTKHGRVETFELQAVLADGERVRLIGGMSSDAAVHYLERKIEQHLQIEDRPVPGEVQR